MCHSGLNEPAVQGLPRLSNITAKCQSFRNNSSKSLRDSQAQKSQLKNMSHYIWAQIKCIPFITTCLVWPVCTDAWSDRKYTNSTLQYFKWLIIIAPFCISHLSTSTSSTQQNPEWGFQRITCSNKWSTKSGHWIRTSPKVPHQCANFLKFWLQRRPGSPSCYPRPPLEGDSNRHPSTSSTLQNTA